MSKEYIAFLFHRGVLDREYLKLAIEFGQLSQSDYDDIVKES